MSRILTISFVVLLIAGGFLWSRSRPGSPADEKVEAPVVEATGTPQDVPAASGILFDELDLNTRPQDDFYAFANGTWLANTPIPPIYPGYTVYHQTYEKTEAALKKIVEEAAAAHAQPGTEAQQVGDIFNSWMDVDTINALGVGAVQDELDLVASITDVSSLVRVMAQLTRRGVQTPYEIEISPDMKNSSRNAVYVGQSGLTMPDRDYYLVLDNENFTKARDALPAYMQGMLVRAGTDPAHAAEQATRIYAIEHAIAEAQWDNVSNRDPDKIYNPIALDVLDGEAKNMDWQLTRSELGLQGIDMMVLYQPSYFAALDRLLAGIPLDDWKTYLTYQVMDSRGINLDAETAALRFDYRNRTLNGQEEERPRWKLGVSVVNNLVGEAVGKLYVAEYFPPEAKAKMEILVDNVISTLDETLGELAWMSPETRVRAQEKLSKLVAKIGYPDEWKDYSRLKIVAGDHIGNLRRAIEWQYQENIDKLAKPVDRKEWFMTPQTVNAYYDPTKNEIVFPAARLQPPFFQLNADDAINYGAVGGVIGHEISHGFDDSGSKFDGDGNLVNWWTDADRTAFEALTAALVAQYNEFEPLPGMHVNGELTLGENIGDVSGVAMAYRAYIRSMNGTEPAVIDGYTGPQRFFIGYAMSRKGKYQDESAISQLASDPHSPLKYRVNGVYRNLDAFHEAFGTVEGDGMWLAPEKRVRMW